MSGLKSSALEDIEEKTLNLTKIQILVPVNARFTDHTVHPTLKFHSWTQNEFPLGPKQLSYCLFKKLPGKTFENVIWKQ